MCWLPVFSLCWLYWLNFNYFPQQRGSEEGCSSEGPWQESWRRRILSPPPPTSPLHKPRFPRPRAPLPSPPSLSARPGPGKTHDPHPGLNQCSQPQPHCQQIQKFLHLFTAVQFLKLKKTFFNFFCSKSLLLPFKAIKFSLIVYFLLLQLGIIQPQEHFLST